MKTKIFKILGVAVTVAMVLTLAAAFAAPAAGAETLNKWYKFGYPKAGSAGDWFRQGTGAEQIYGTGPIAEAINGDLYCYVEISGTDGDRCHIFKSEDGGRSWADTGYTDLEVCSDTDHPDAVVDMVCSSIDEDVVYATDGSYVYKTEDGGDT